MNLGELRELEAISGDLSQYRVRAVSLLRKYFKMSVELGRLPSLLGREFFRTQVTSYSTHTFEDAVIFVHDMDRALQSLPPAAQLVIARVFFQEYTYSEAAQLQRIPRRTFLRTLAASLDAFSGIMLERGLMECTHEPISAHEAGKLQRIEVPHQCGPVSLSFLMSLRNPTYCQGPKIRKMKIR